KSDYERKQAQQKWENFWTGEKMAQVQQWINTAAATHGIDAGALISLKDFVAQKQFDYADASLAHFKTLMPLSISSYQDTVAYITSIKVTTEARKDVIKVLENSNDIIITDKQSTAETLIE